MKAKLVGQQQQQSAQGRRKKMAVMAFIHTYKKEKKSYLPSHQFLHTLYFFFKLKIFQGYIVQEKLEF